MSIARARLRRLPMRQFVRYTGVGACGTAVHYTTLVALVELGGVAPGLAAAAGAAVGAATGYALNYHMTFRSRAAHGVTLPRFLTIALAGLVANAIIVDLGTRLLGVHYMAAQVVATAVVLVAGFAANHLWTFRTTATTPPATHHNRLGREET